MRALLFLTATALFTVFSSLSLAQVSTTNNVNALPNAGLRTGELELNIVKPALSGQEKSQGSIVLAICANSHANAETKAVCGSALARELDARGEQFEIAVQLDRQRVSFEFQTNEITLAVLKQQRFEAKILFWLAIGIVGLGLLSAGAQFYLAWTNRGGDSPMEISVSKDSFTVKTAWIGVVLFALSITFFSLYLFQVFKIQAI